MAAEGKTAAVGTLNAGKHQAVQDCFNRWPQMAGVGLKGVNVPSGVSDQPMGLDETIEGAKNRAKAAYAACAPDDSCVVGVGLESGLVISGGMHFDCCACAIFDGASEYVGVSSLWALPPAFVATYQERGYNQAFEVAFL